MLMHNLIMLITIPPLIIGFFIIITNYWIVFVFFFLLSSFFIFEKPILHSNIGSLKLNYKKIIKKSFNEVSLMLRLSTDVFTFPYSLFHNKEEIIN